MGVICHPDAQNRLCQAVVYVQTEYGRSSSAKFIKEVYRSERLIAKFPYLGPAVVFVVFLLGAVQHEVLASALKITLGGLFHSCDSQILKNLSYTSYTPRWPVTNCLSINDLTVV